MNKLIKKIYKKNYKIDIKSLESGPLTCNTVITVTGPLGIASYIFHNQPIGLEKGTFFGYSMDFVKDRIEKLILGVTEGWTFELHLNGIGFKSFKIDDWYCLDVGFSNLIKYKPKPEVIIKNMKNKIILYSVDEDYLKHVSYALREFAYPDVYKGKGITLKNEILKLKKKAKANMSVFIEFKNKKNKQLIYALRDIYGLGLSSSKKICKSLGYDITTKISNFRSEDLNKLTAIINVQYKFITGAELKKKTYDKIQQMKNIRSYKGVRHSYNLPVNGQRTHTNAKTRGWR